MRKTQESQLRQYRRKLGDALRRADDVVGPIKTALVERGLRWEPEDTLVAMIAVDDLEQEAGEVFVDVVDFVNRYQKSLTEPEFEWLAGGKKRGQGGAVGRLKAGVQLLDSIDNKKLLALEDKFFEEGTEVSAGHEAYFLGKYGSGARLLRKAWVHLYYATARNKRARQVKLSERETKAWFNPLTPGVRDKIRQEAFEAAAETGNYVEIYTSDGELIDWAIPPSTLQEAEMSTARRGERGQVKPRLPLGGLFKRREPTPGIRMAPDVTPEQQAAVRVLMLERPGMGLREAAEEVGIEVVAIEQLTPNRPRVRRGSDLPEGLDLFNIDF